MKHYSMNQRKAHIREWQNSGKSINQYCRDNNLKATTFHTWKKRYSKKSEPLVEIAAPKVEIRFSPIQLRRGPYLISLESDFDQVTLKKVLTVLEQLHD